MRGRQKILKFPHSFSDGRVEVLDCQPKKEKREKRTPTIRLDPWWTMVANGKGNRGCRWMFRAKDFAQALKKSLDICRTENVDFVHVFSGHMHRLEYA